MGFLKLKRTILVALVAVILLSGSTMLSAAKRPQVGYIEEIMVPYTEALVEGAKKWAEFFGIDLYVKWGEFDPQVIDKYLRAFIAQEVDAIMLKPWGGEFLRPSIIAAYEADIPLVFIIDRVDAPCAFYVGGDFWSEGRNLGEIVVEALGDKGKMVIIEGDPGGYCNEQRKGGLVERVGESPDIEIVDTQPGFWKREDAMLVAERLLTAYPDIDLISCHSDMMCLGALAAVKEAGKEDQVKIVGFDFPKELIPYIQNGEIYGVSYIIPGEVTQLAVTAVASILSLEYPSERWESVPAPPGGTKGPTWKQVFGSIRTGAHKVTVNDIDEKIADAF